MSKHTTAAYSGFSVFSSVLRRRILCCLFFLALCTLTYSFFLFSDPKVSTTTGGKEDGTSISSITSFTDNEAANTSVSINGFSSFSQALLSSLFGDSALRFHAHFPNEITDSKKSLGSFLLSSLKARAEAAEEGLSMIQSLSSKEMREEESLSYEILTDFLKGRQEAGNYTIFMNPLTGPGNALSETLLLLEDFPFSSRRDVDLFLSLLEDLPRYLSEAESFLKEQGEKGIFLPKEVLSRSIQFCQSLVQSAKESPQTFFLTAALSRGVNTLEDLDLASDYLKTYEKILACQVLPAYEAFAVFLSSCQGTDQGLSAFPGGIAYYQWLLSARVGTDQTPAKLAQWISSHLVADIRQMNEIAEKSSSLSSHGKTSSAALTYADFQELCQDLQTFMASDFPSLPAMASVSCKLYPLPKVLCGSSPAVYVLPPSDNWVENHVYLNSSLLDETDPFVTLAHEVYPGHVYQNAYLNAYWEENAISLADSSLSSLRQLVSYPGFTEGWATYVQWLSYEYRKDLTKEEASFLSHQSSATLALYSLCDLHVHLDGWGKEEVYRFLKVWAPSLEEKDALAIYENILANPASYLTYYCMAARFRDMAEEAQTQLGEMYARKDFHTFLLELGPCPQNILEEQFLLWLIQAASA